MSEFQLILLLYAATAILAFVALRYWRRYRQLRERFKDVLDVEVERDKLIREKDDLTRKVSEQRSRWEEEFTRTVSQLEDLTEKLDAVRDTGGMQ